jgi:hypothetical protein
LTVYNVPEILKMIKAGRLMWLGHLCRMHEQDSCSKLTFHEPEGFGRICCYTGTVKVYLKIMGIRNWGRKLQDPIERRAVAEEDKVHD